MTAEEAKDLAAQKIGYDNWADLISMIGHKSLKELRYTQYDLALEKAIQAYAEAKAKEFAEWYSKLTPTQKITVHPPAGSGGSICIYEMTIKQLYETFKQSK